MISIVIPAFNEEAAIADTINTAKEVLKNTKYKTYEILVVDDGSVDNTATLAKEAGAKVIQHPHNSGYGRSLKDGINGAKFDTVVITDADGTYPLDEIPSLVEEYEKGFNMVVGARTGKHYRESWFKAPLRMILKGLVEFTAGRKIEDINSGLRVFSKKEAIPYFEHLCNTFSFTTSITLAYMMTGKYVLYRPIAYNKRVGNSKVRLFRDSLRTLQYIVQAILYYNPIKIFMVLCGITLFFSAFCFLTSAFFHLASAFYLGIGSVLVSIVIMSLGLLADLLRQIMVK